MICKIFVLQEKLDARAAEAAVALQARVDEAQGQISQFYADLQEKTQNRATGNKADEARYVEDRDAAVQVPLARRTRVLPTIDSTLASGDSRSAVSI